MWVGASQYLTAGLFHCLRSCGHSAGGRDLLVRQKDQPRRLKEIILARIKTLPRNNKPTNPRRIKHKTKKFQCFLNISDVTASSHSIMWYLRQCFCFSPFKKSNESMSFCLLFCCQCFSEGLCIRLAVVSAVEEVSLESKQLSLERFLLNNVSESQRNKMFLNCEKP